MKIRKLFIDMNNKRIVKKENIPYKLKKEN